MEPHIISMNCDIKLIRFNTIKDGDNLICKLLKYHRRTFDENGKNFFLDTPNDVLIVVSSLNILSSSIQKYSCSRSILERHLDPHNLFGASLVSLVAQLCCNSGRVCVGR